MILDHTYANFLADLASEALHYLGIPSHLRFGHFEYFYHSKQIVQSTADLIAKWQALGFCHGAMNTR